MLKHDKLIQDDRLEMVQRYAALTGARVEDCIDEALHDWLAATAAARISQNEKNQPVKDNVVCISSFRRNQKRLA